MNVKVCKADFDAAGRVFPCCVQHPEALPIQFTYDGRKYYGLPSPCTVKREIVDANIVRHVFTSTLPDGLEVQLTHTEYRDYPVREWIATFTNWSDVDSGILEDARIGGHIDGSFCLLEHSNGDNCNETGYEVFEDAVEKPMELMPDGGTSCAGASPYMKLTFADFTVRVGIGFTARWSAKISKDAWGVHYTVGQKRCHMCIYPGETMRTPAVTMLIHTGDADRSRNLWRRFYIDHILPREDGHPLQPLLCLHNWCSEGMPEFTGATEANQCGALQRYLDKGLKPDLWWIDAGWYPCDGNWTHTGSWEVDTRRFPRGLAPIGEMCAKEGIRFLLWFEPERVMDGTWLREVHPEWMLSTYHEDGSEDGTHFLDLSNDAACDWCIEQVDRILTESGVNIYRQDFNYAPQAAWEIAEAEDRVGAMENRHVQNLLRFWDALLERHPGMWIDNCSSGGRRNDLDMMRRSVPLHYTDVGYGNHLIKQKQHRYMFEWIPYFRAHTMSWDNAEGQYVGGGYEIFLYHQGDVFAFENAMAPAITAMVNYQADDQSFAESRQMVAQWREVAPLMLSGDYYPLTACRKDAHDWYAMQFDDSESGRGFVQVIRNILVQEDAFTLRMHIEDGKVYTFSNLLTGESFTKTAEELKDGLTVHLAPRTGLTLAYTVA